jgi:hypothetical protein
MRFAEVFLRLGSSLVAWMMIYTYAVWMAALHVIGCGPEGDEMHRVLLGVALLALFMALALRLTRPFPDIHRMLGRLVLPLALLGPFVVKNTWVVFRRTNLDGLAICAEQTPSTLQITWAPAQFFTIFGLTALFVAMRRSERVDKH